MVKQFMPMLKSEDVAEAVVWALSTPPNVQVCIASITLKLCKIKLNCCVVEC